MSGYSGRAYQTRPDDAVSGRLTVAATGRRTNMWQLLDMIGRYIEERVLDQDDFYGVPCPTENEWLRLSGGKRAMLPTMSQLKLYATPKMQAFAASHNLPLYRAYFLIAAYRLKHPRNRVMDG